MACDYLTAHGAVVKEKNFRCRQGEIDLIVLHDGYLVFVEVKYRKNINKGSAAQAVNLKKQYTICRVADYYRCVHHTGLSTKIRFDVVTIQNQEITWIKNAFYYR